MANEPNVPPPTPWQHQRMQALLRGLQEILDNGGQPTAAALEAAPFIERWIVSTRPDNPLHPCLVGYVTGHPRLPDGLSTTSALVYVDPGLKWARTVGRLYRLGEPLDARWKLAEATDGGHGDDVDR